MRSLAIALALAAAGAAAAAAPARADEPTPKKVDISSVKGDLAVLHDGSGHYVVAHPYELSEHLYYGDGETFFRQRAYSGFSDESSGRFSRSFWSPRVNHKGTVRLADGSDWEMQCGERETPLVRLEGKEAAKILDEATFRDVYWPRVAYALSRDDRGRYYFVDRLRDPYGGKGYRLFVGPKGKLENKQMINVVSDSEGDIFATKSGALRLVLNEDQSVWIRGDDRKKLTIVPPRQNLAVIYAELGVYRGDLGTPCDDM